MPTGRHNLLRSLTTALACAVAAALLPAPAHAQYRPDRVDQGTPVAVPNPEVTDKAGAKIPQDLEFTDDTGKTVKLGNYFNHNRPVIITMVYFSCPNLCTYVQDNLVNAVREGPRDLKLGKDYDIVIVSIDPDDKPSDAAQRRARYLQIAEKPADQQGLYYLTGKEENISTLASTIGFGYRRNFGLATNDSSGKFAHSAGVFVCTPYGTVSQTIQGVNWPTDKLHYSLIQASDGKIGSGFLESVALPCGAVRLGAHGYEHNPWFWAGTAGGAATFAFMAVFLGMMWRGEFKKKRTTGDNSSSSNVKPA